MTSLIHLQAIWRFKQKELDKEILSFIERWNTEHKCNCCKNWKRGDEEIECVHLEKKINKNFGKRIDYQYNSLTLIKSFSFNRFLNNNRLVFLQ